MENLDLRAKEFKIKFDKGTSLAFTLLYLGSDYTVIDLTGYSAHLTVWPERSDTSFAYNSPSSEITFTTGSVELDDGTTVANVHGVAVLLPDETTTGFLWDGALFTLTLESSTGVIIPFAKGEFCAFTPGRLNG